MQRRLPCHSVHYVRPPPPNRNCFLRLWVIGDGAWLQKFEFWIRPSEWAVLTLPCKCFGIHCSPKVDITRKSPRSFMSTAPLVSTFHLLDATCCHCMWWDLLTLYLHICITWSDQILVAERPGNMFCQTHDKMSCNYNYACLLVVRKIVPKVYSIRTLLWTTVGIYDSPLSTKSAN